MRYYDFTLVTNAILVSIMVISEVITLRARYIKWKERRPVLSRKMEYPRIKDADNKLREACLKGIDRRYSSNLKEEALNKLEEELSIIRKQGSASGYVLVNNALTVVDAKPNEFYMRGTIGSTIVSYVLGFTDTDPLTCVPQLYSVFFYGINGERHPYFDAFVSPDLQRRLVDFFEHYPEDDNVEFRRESDNSLLGVYVGELREENKREEGLWDAFYFGMITSKDFDIIGNNPVEDEISEACKPNSLAEYVKCDGLRHGSYTWDDNGDVLFKEKSIPLKDLIAYREDVYEYMRDHGITDEMAYEIAEYVSIGKVSRRGWPEDMSNAMEKADVPNWYLVSCQMIGYLFPRAHFMEWYKTFRPDIV